MAVTPRELEALPPRAFPSSSPPARYFIVLRHRNNQSLTRVSQLIIASAFFLLIYVSSNRLPLSLPTFTIPLNPTTPDDKDPSAPPDRDLPLSVSSPSANSVHEYINSSPHPTSNTPPSPTHTIPISLIPFSYPPNSSYIYSLFTPVSASQADTTIRRIPVHDAISDDCLKEWIGNGRWEGACLQLRIEEPRVDLVWTWVNGSDPLHVSARKEMGSTPITKLFNSNWNEKQYREHDELRFAMRSAEAATKRWKHTKFHLIANSYKFPSYNSTRGEEGEDDLAYSQNNVTRLGQVPQWLDVTKIGDTRPTVMIHHDIELFRPLPESPTDEISAEELAAWRNATIPTFNSLAVESQLANLSPSDVSDNTVFLMDDNYFLRPLTTSSFFSPIHGPVLHFQADLLVKPNHNGFLPPDGEWRGLNNAAAKLSERFGFRGRPYLIHNARSLPLPLLHEASVAFPSAFSGTALSRFRGQDISGAESHTLWLASHYIVERHREALLWSWVVGKWGGHNGIISLEDKRNMWHELGIEGDEESNNVRWPKRESRLNVKIDLAKTRLPPNSATDYSFVSADGYPYTYLPVSNYHPPRPHTINGWPDLIEPSVGLPETPQACRLERSDFLGNENNVFEPAAEMLKRIMVDRPICGDCVISSLLHSTGSTGLSVFLPPSSTSKSSPPSDASSPPTHLPLTLPALLTFPYPSNPHIFALRLIQRYSYVLGATPSRFFGVTSAVDAKHLLNETDIMTETALLCVNDDMFATHHAEVEALDDVMRDWMEGRWPKKLGFEKGDFNNSYSL